MDEGTIYDKTSIVIHIIRNNTTTPKYQIVSRMSRMLSETSKLGKWRNNPTKPALAKDDFDWIKNEKWNWFKYDLVVIREWSTKIDTAKNPLASVPLETPQSLSISLISGSNRHNKQCNRDANLG